MTANISENRIASYPPYSVLMSVYHREKPEFLRAAMDSMFSQTVPPGDFVLVCDGPLPAELNTVIDGFERAYPDILNVVRLPENKGLGGALNEGLPHCKYEIVARMDSDDISLPDRCETQLKLFAANPALALSSGTILEFDGDISNITGKRELPEAHEDIVRFARKRSPMNHPCVMFRRSAVAAAGGYNEEYHFFEDYYLWVRMLVSGALSSNCKAPLLYMRVNGNTYSRRGGKAYASDLLRFHKWMRKSGFSSRAGYITGALPHAAVCRLPVGVRRLVYKVIH